MDINKRTSELLINKMLNAQNPNSKSSDFASKMDQRGVEFFAPLRSAQSRGPPDLVRPCPKTRLRHVLSITKTSSGPQEKGSEEAHASSLPFPYGPEGSRTPVRKPIPCSSTIIVDCLTFPSVHGNQHPCTFSSFMIRPASQSFDTVVSYMFEAWVLKCRCFKSDCCNQAAYAKLSLAFIFKFGF